MGAGVCDGERQGLHSSCRMDPQGAPEAAGPFHITHPSASTPHRPGKQLRGLSPPAELVPSVAGQSRSPAPSSRCKQCGLSSLRESPSPPRAHCLPGAASSPPAMASRIRPRTDPGPGSAEGPPQPPAGCRGDAGGAVVWDVLQDTASPRGTNMFPAPCSKVGTSHHRDHHLHRGPFALQPQSILCEESRGPRAQTTGNQDGFPRVPSPQPGDQP